MLRSLHDSSALYNGPSTDVRADVIGDTAAVWNAVLLFNRDFVVYIGLA